MLAHRGWVIVHCRVVMHQRSSTLNTMPLQVWSVKINGLFEEPNMGVLLGTVTLLLGIVSRNYEGYEAVVPKVRVGGYPH